MRETLVYLRNGTGASYGRISCKWPEAIGGLQIAWRYKVYQWSGMDTLIFPERELQRLNARELGT